MPAMTRRGFVQTAGAIGAGLALPGVVPAASAAAIKEAPPFRLGIVTYNIAADWDLPTIVKVCRNVGIGDVELRTTHKHGVEPSLGKPQRQDVRKQFADAGVNLWGLGTTCEFQSPDASVVSKNIETCRQFIDLARDLGAKGVKVRPNVGVTWNSNPEDVVHGSVAESFALLRPWIRSCHINELYRDGQGRYPYRELFRLFGESGYDRVTLCEVARGMPTPDAGEEMLRYYKALWTELARG